MNRSATRRYRSERVPCVKRRPAGGLFPWGRPARAERERNAAVMHPKSQPRLKEHAMSASRQFAIVTGASTGIGLELAKCCASNGFDLLIAADEPEIEAAAAEIRGLGAMVEPVQT